MNTYMKIETEVKTCAAHCDYELATSETENLVKYCIATICIFAASFMHLLLKNDYK